MRGSGTGTACNSARVSGCQIEHQHPIAQVAHGWQIVRDEQQRQVHLLLRGFEQRGDLRLDRDVQCRERLIANDELGLDDQGARDADTLGLTAGELVRVALQVLRFQTHALEHRRGGAAPLCAAELGPEHLQRLAQDRADLHAWIERGGAVLENHLQMLAH